MDKQRLVKKLELLQELELHRESLLADSKELPTVKPHQLPTLEKYITAVLEDFDVIMEEARKVLGEVD